MKLLVSACLLGVGCRYDGKSNQIPRLAELMKKHTCIPVCAELFGGLPTPRVPAERQGNKVINRDGQDVTDAFVRGTAVQNTLGSVHDGDLILRHQFLAGLLIVQAIGVVVGTGF